MTVSCFSDRKSCSTSAARVLTRAVAVFTVPDAAIPPGWLWNRSGIQAGDADRKFAAQKRHQVSSSRVHSLEAGLPTATRDAREPARLAGGPRGLGDDKHLQTAADDFGDIPCRRP
jgi:hypothetical protein